MRTCDGAGCGAKIIGAPGVVANGQEFCVGCRDAIVHSLGDAELLATAKSSQRVAAAEKLKADQERTDAARAKLAENARAGAAALPDGDPRKDFMTAQAAQVEKRRADAKATEPKS